MKTNFYQKTRKRTNDTLADVTSSTCLDERSVHSFVCSTMAPSLADSVFTAGQRQSLQGVIDGFLPPLLVPPRENDATTLSLDHKKYFQSRLATDDAFWQALIESFQSELSTAERLSIQSLLTLLSSSFGTTLLVARPSKAFVQYSVPMQSNALSQLQHSTRTHHQRLHRLLQHWICRTAYTYMGTTSKYSSNSNNKKMLQNPHFAAMEYSPSVHSNNNNQQYNKYSGLVCNDKIQPQTTLTTNKSPSSLNNNTQEDHSTKTVLRIDCDILIVGSGPASAVAASVLSKAGYQVLVVEQGTHYGHDHLAAMEASGSSTTFTTNNNTKLAATSSAWTDEGNALRHCYHGAARYGGTKQCAPVILAGNTLGGGSTIGYGACLPLSEPVWKEWLKTIFVSSSEQNGYGNGGENANGNVLLDDQGQRFQEEYAAAMDFVTHKLGLPAISSRQNIAIDPTVVQYSDFEFGCFC
jgi:hypothetical protein